MRVELRDARVVTLAAGPRPRRGPDLADLAVVPRATIMIDDGTIVGVIPDGAPAPATAGARTAPTMVLEAAGRVVLPGFVDAHTHACWAGQRIDEWEQSRWPGGDAAHRTAAAGSDDQPAYLRTLARGGGILSTVRAVRAASEAELEALLRLRLAAMLAEGTTTVEVKSGYGLNTADELKMLRAIASAGADWPGTVVATALVGHAIDPHVPDFVDRTIRETLPAVHAEFPSITIDAYCEEGAWSLADCLRLFDRALELGHPVRVHADQFHDLGMIPEAIRRGLRSVDHLEASSTDHLRALAQSETFGVMLPCTGFHLEPEGARGARAGASGVGGRVYADGRGFVDAGGALAVATNYNPGSSPCASMPMVVALASRRLGLRAAEAIAAATVNPATLLGCDDRGTIAAGQRADLVMLRHEDERALAYEFGGSPVEVVICGGQVVRGVEQARPRES